MLCLVDAVDRTLSITAWQPVGGRPDRRSAAPVLWHRLGQLGQRPRKPRPSPARGGADRCR